MHSDFSLKSNGADLVSAVDVRANPAAARPMRLPNSQNYSTVTPQPMVLGPFKSKNICLQEVSRKFAHY